MALLSFLANDKNVYREREIILGKKTKNVNANQSVQNSETERSRLTNTLLSGLTQHILQTRAVFYYNELVI